MSLKPKVYLITFLMMALVPLNAAAKDISLNGFIQGNYSLNTDRENPDGSDFKWAEERAQLRLNADKEPFHLFFKGDAFYDHVDDKADVELREGYFDYTSDKWDLRIGRQVITWGLGDLIFINDIFPKDYEAFFSGRPMEYFKKGVDGLKAGIYPSFASIEFVAVPFFTPNNYPSKSRFWMFDPMQAVTNRVEKEPSSNITNTELALRVYKDINGLNTSLYAYRGYFRQPSILPNDKTSPTRLTLFYPELSLLGMSLEGKLLKGVMSLEAGYYDSRQDEDGDDAMIPNSSSRLLLGYQRQIWKDFTLGLQYYSELMSNYSGYELNLPQGFPREREIKQLTSIRLTQLLIHQTLKVSLFSFWSLSEGDYLLNPEIKYNFTDHLWAALGGNVFGGGERWSQFGQLDRNDNAYLQARYEF